MIDSITRITLNLQETNTMVSIRAKRGDTGRKLLIHLSDGSIPYHISDDCYATFTAKKPDGTKINNACTIENNVIEYEFTDQTCTAVGTMKAEIRLYGADDKMITSACFLVNVYDTVFRDGDEVGSETEMNTLDDLILRANAFLNETGKLLRWQGNWNSETEYEANDLVLHEEVLYVAEEAIAAGTVPGSEEVTAWVPIAGMGTGSGADLTEQVDRAEAAAQNAESAAATANNARAQAQAAANSAGVYVGNAVAAMNNANAAAATAEAAKESVGTSVNLAGGYASSAHSSANRAEQAKTSAQGYANSASSSATRAEEAAARAEEAAAEAGNGSGGNVNLDGYATEQWVKDQNYLTAIPEGYAKSSEIPTKPEDIGALPITYTPPKQTAEQVGADPKGTAASAVTQHNTADDSHNDIRLELKAINDRLTAFFNSDDQTLDELSEIIAIITSNKSLIEAITTSKVSITDIVDNLTTNVAKKPLSAAQGVVLKGLIDTISKSLGNYQPKGNYAMASSIPTKVSQLENDKNYLTQHQDISGKLDASALPGAINTALAQAKESGAFDGADGYTPRKGIDYFDGADGQRGAGILNTTTGIAAYTTAVGGVSPKYRILLSTLKTQANVNEVLVGDTVRYSTFIYPVIYVDESYAYMGTRISLQGSAGSSITVKSVNESTADEGSNIVTFSDGKTLTVKNGKKGTDGKDGTSLNVTTYETSDGRNGMTFETTDYLPDGTPVTQNHGSIEDGKDYILTEADKAEIVSRVVETIGGNPIYGVVDANNHIILNGNLSDGTYSVQYEMEDGSTVNIGNLVLDSNVYYTVTSNLTQCTNSNSAARVVQGGSYSATITAKSGYALKSVTVTMGGSAVTVSGGNISISNVTGDIVITAVAEKTAVEIVNQIPLSTDSSGNPYNGGQGWKTGYRLSTSSASETAASGIEITGFIPIKYTDTIYFKNITITTSSSETYLFYDTNRNKITGGTTGGTFGTTNGEVLSKTISSINNDQLKNQKDQVGYIRICAKEITADSVITVNQPLT